MLAILHSGTVFRQNDKIEVQMKKIDMKLNRFQEIILPWITTLARKDE
jgi:hypothetical protein